MDEEQEVITGALRYIFCVCVCVLPERNVLVSVAVV